MDEAGKVLAKRRVPEGAAGMTQLHALIGRFLPEDAQDAEVVIGIETDRGPWVAALIAAGYTVFPVNPLQASRYRERHGVSGAKSDQGDSHMLADMVRTDSHQLRPAAGDSPEGQGIKVVARAHKTLISDRTARCSGCGTSCASTSPPRWRRSRTWTPPMCWNCWARPRTRSGRQATRAQVAAALKRARRRDIAGKTDAILAALRGEHLGLRRADRRLRGNHPVPDRGDHHVERPGQDRRRAGEGAFWAAPDAEIYQSQPGLAAILGARVLGEFGDDPRRYVSAKARKNYGGTSPITRASGKKKVVAARFIHNDRLVDALMSWAFSSLQASPGARAFYDEQRAKGLDHSDALRRLANRLVGILRGS